MTLQKMTELNDGHQLAIPRKTGRQTLRANHPSSTPEQYYYRSLYLPYVDHLVAEMDRRFASSPQLVQGRLNYLAFGQKQVKLKIVSCSGFFKIE